MPSTRSQLAVWADMKSAASSIRLAESQAQCQTVETNGSEERREDELRSQLAAQASALATAVETLAAAEARAAAAEAKVQQALATAAVSVEMGVSEIQGAVDAVEAECKARLEQQKLLAAEQLLAERSRIAAREAAQITAGYKLAAGYAMIPRSNSVRVPRTLGYAPSAAAMLGVGTYHSRVTPRVPTSPPVRFAAPPSATPLARNAHKDESGTTGVLLQQQEQWTNAVWDQGKQLAGEAWPKTQQMEDTTSSGSRSSSFSIDSIECLLSCDAMQPEPMSIGPQACPSVQDSEMVLRDVIQARTAYEFSDKSFDRSDVDAVNLTTMESERPCTQKPMVIVKRDVGIELRLNHEAPGEVSSRARSCRATRTRSSRDDSGSRFGTLSADEMSPYAATGFIDLSSTSAASSSLVDKHTMAEEGRLVHPVRLVQQQLETVDIGDNSDESPPPSPPSPTLRHLTEYCQILDELHRVIHVDTTLWMRNWRLRQVFWAWCQLAVRPQVSMRRRVGGGFEYTTTHSFNMRELIAFAKHGWTIHLV